MDGCGSGGGDCYEVGWEDDGEDDIVDRLLRFVMSMRDKLSTSLLASQLDSYPIERTLCES